MAVHCKGKKQKKKDWARKPLIQEAIERLTNTNTDLLSRKGRSFEKEMDGEWMRSGKKAYGCG
jgi:hypothetical protein